jgi:hypothetical protein
MGGHAVYRREQEEGKPMMDKPETPFPRHWLYYIIIKLVVIVLAVAAALRYFGYV